MRLNKSRVRVSLLLQMFPFKWEGRALNPRGADQIQATNTPHLGITMTISPSFWPKAECGLMIPNAGSFTWPRLPKCPRPSESR